MNKNEGSKWAKHIINSAIRRDSNGDIIAFDSDGEEIKQAAPVEEKKLEKQPASGKQPLRAPIMKQPSNSSSDQV